ncbi:MAG: hypothetical protein ACPGTO_07350 [Polaribacter sp.]
MSTNQNKKEEEEVDLGSLFIIIGRGFSKFFNFIGSIFKEVFHVLISVLIFLKKNTIKIGIAAVLGIISGFVLEVKKPTTYGSEMLVEPNFKSARQLYNNVNYYNDLVKQKDTVTIQKTFDLDKETAGGLKKFTIEPIRLENDIIEAYDGLILALDTLTIKSYEYDDFKNSFTDFDYRVHKINVISKNNNVFKKIGDVIISSVVDNKYFSKSKELLNENLNRTDSVYRQNLSQIDSLRKVYMQVLLDEAKKQSNGTNIDLGGQKTTTKELELFETNRKLNVDLRGIADEKAKKYEVINVISNFQSVGYEIKGVTKNYAFLLGLLGASLMIVFLLLIQLNNYLNNYKK